MRRVWLQMLGCNVVIQISEDNSVLGYFGHFLLIVMCLCSAYLKILSMRGEMRFWSRE